MWLLLESFRLPSKTLFKLSGTSEILKHIYLFLSPFIISSRAYLIYNTVEQLILGYLFGSLTGTIVFIFIQTTTLSSQKLRSGLNPFWAKIGLKNNLSPISLELGTLNDKLTLSLLRKKYESLKEAKEDLRESYEQLESVTRPLFQKNRMSSGLCQNKKFK